MIGYLISHPCSDQGEQVFQQAGVVLSVQVRQGALLSDWCIWVLHNTHPINVFLTVCITVSFLHYCVVKPYQLSDQRNSEGSAALPP